MTKFQDLGDREEDERIDIIAHTITAHRMIVGFVVENDAKADRYVRKLQEKARVRVLGRYPGPSPNTVMVRVGPPSESLV